MPDFSAIRRLGPDDLKSCMALSVDRGWLPEKRKWGLLLETAEVFGIDAPDGGLAGSVTLARYGGDHASVGMMLVAARYGRRGLGRALMTHLLDAAGGATVTLFATAMGRPLYERLGFKPVGRSVSFVGAFRASPGELVPGDTARGVTAPGNAAVATRPATAADLPAILELDRAAFGADRSQFIRRLPSFAERILVSRTDSGPSVLSASGVPASGVPASGVAVPASGPGISGYAAAWSNGSVTVIGPVIAPDGVTARRLIADLAADARGPVRLDLDPDRPELPAWAEARGLPPKGMTTVMAHGPWDPPGDRARIFAPITVALTLRPWFGACVFRPATAAGAAMTPLPSRPCGGAYAVALAPAMAHLQTLPGGLERITG